MTFSNGMQWVTFSPISDNMILHYNKSSVAIDFFSLVYMIVYPFVNFPSSYILDKVSVRLGVKFLLKIVIYCIIGHYYRRRIQITNKL